MTEPKRLRGNLRAEIRSIAIATFIHLFVIGIGFIYFHYAQDEPRGVQQRLLPFGGSGGGGGEQGAKKKQARGFEIALDDAAVDPSSLPMPAPLNSSQIQLLRLRIAENVPPPKVEEKKPDKPVVEKKNVRRKKQSLAIMAPPPKRHVRRTSDDAPGVGPGSGGGVGGGSGGGIGTGRGFSIEWGTGDSRRLLSGELPEYPSGTDKEMPVTLRFSVLPNGTVQSAKPVRKSDAKLEQAALRAILTWRFEPLPEQLAQTLQEGQITFNFVIQ